MTIGDFFEKQVGCSPISFLKSYTNNLIEPESEDGQPYFPINTFIMGSLLLSGHTAKVKGAIKWGIISRIALLTLGNLTTFLERRYGYALTPPQRPFFVYQIIFGATAELASIHRGFLRTVYTSPSINTKEHIYCLVSDPINWGVFGLSYVFYKFNTNPVTIFHKLSAFRYGFLVATLLDPLFLIWTNTETDKTRCEGMLKFCKEKMSSSVYAYFFGNTLTPTPIGSLDSLLEKLAKEIGHTLKSKDQNKKWDELKTPWKAWILKNHPDKNYNLNDKEKEKIKKVIQLRSDIEHMLK